MVDLFHDLAFTFVDHKITNRLIFLVGSPQKLQLITKWDQAAAVKAFLNHLEVLCTDTQRSFFAFAGRLPETDVVEQFIDMVVKPLLTFFCAPDLNPVFYEPLDDERRFIVTSANAVEHEDKKNVKLFRKGLFFDA